MGGTSVQGSLVASTLAGEFFVSFSHAFFLCIRIKIRSERGLQRQKVSPPASKPKVMAELSVMQFQHRGTLSGSAVWVGLRRMEGEHAGKAGAV